MSEPHPDDLIAIIGLAARVPGAGGADQFWLNLLEQRESIAFLDEDQLRAAGVPAEALADPHYVRAAAEAPDLELFDAPFFGFSPRDAAVLDPQIRMFLEVTHTAVENAGYDPFRIGGSVGVYGATGVNGYVNTNVRRRGDHGMSTHAIAQGVLSMPDYLATHVSYRFGFSGPAMTLSTACSSSAVAVHLACQALRVGECDLALAGGADLETPVHHGYRWDAEGPLSPDGHCRPFDRAAAGTIFGSGAGAVLLKRLGDAVADGDHVWAVIRGSAVNNDGAAKAGFSAPGVPGQAAAIVEAMRMAGAAPADVSYVEAHATGTVMGDPVEVAALAKAYDSLGPVPRQAVVLSSVKGNVGHLGHAAGITSLVKLALCLANERRAGTANFTASNPRLDLPATPFAVHGAATGWPRTAGRPRVAGMSSLGIGGTNVHLVVEEGPAPARTPPPDRPQVMVWSARTDRAVRDYAAGLADHLRSGGEDAFADTIATLQDGRTAYPARAAVLAGTAAEALAALERGSAVRGQHTGAPRPVTFLFPGQAAQRPRMAAGLYGADPVFTETMDDCLDLFRRSGVDVRDAWLHGDAEVADTALAQPLLFAVEYALAAMWRSWGVRPDAVLGHSIGELAAAAVAGVFDLESATRLVSARAAAMAAMPAGGMLAVSAAPDDLRPHLAGGVVLAAVNGARQTVLAGDRERLAELSGELRAAGFAATALRTSHAFHSPAMAPAVELFAAAFDGVALAEPAVPLISALTGAPVTAEALDPMFWASQLTRPVRFDAALDELAGRSTQVLLEVGPGNTLTQLARVHPGVAGGDAVAVATLPPAAGPDTDHRGALAAAATLWTVGQPVDWAAVRGHVPPRRLPVPGYPYQRERHWIDLAPTPAAAPVPAAVPVGSPAEAAPFSTLTWVERARGAAGPGGRGAPALALLPADAARSRPAVLALQQAGYRVTIARPGHAFAEVDGEFAVRPSAPEDLDAVLDAMARRDGTPALLVHGLALVDWPDPVPARVDEALAESFHSVAALVRRGMRRRGVESLLVLTTRSVDITGTEPLDPVKATLHGLVRSLALEVPELACRLVDVAVPYSDEDLCAEILAGSAEPVAALRGLTRWERAERLYRTADGRVPPLRRGGVYLLTGGLGGLGLAVAREMAATGLAPHLVLVGRRGLDEAAPARIRSALAELARLGATVRVEACDIADRRAARRLFDTVRAHLGPVNGIVHLAGVPGDGMLLRRGRAEAEAVLRPKVAGTLVLAELLDAQPPVDFVVNFSSRAALTGLVGGADYAAANAFLDAQSRLMTRRGLPALSVNWPAWHTVGMAADPPPPTGAGRSSDEGAGPDPAGGRAWSTQVSLDTWPILDEHRIGGNPIMPGTGHLDLIIRAFGEVVGDERIVLTDVVFERPLVVTRTRRVTVTFRPKAAEWSFTLESAAPDGGDAVRHVTGVAGRLATGPAAGEVLAELRQRLAKPAEENPGAVSLVTSGPRWDNIVRMTTAPDGRGELLVEAELPAPFHTDLAVHRLHPALLDSATAEASAFGSGALQPFCYRRLEVYADLPAGIVSHLRERPAGDGLVAADVDVYAEDGRLLVRVEGFTMRQVTGPEALDVTPPPPAPEPAGIDPATGGRLFLSLLGGRLPYQVAVRPYRDGRPVPIPAGAAPPPDPAPAVPSVPAPPAVPAVPVAAPAVPVAFADGGHTVQDRLASLWTEVLGVRAVAGGDDFFELGGNSLAAVELMSRIKETFGVRMSVVAMFDHPTLTGFAEALVAEGVS